MKDFLERFSDRWRRFPNY